MVMRTLLQSLEDRVNFTRWPKIIDASDATFLAIAPPLFAADVLFDDENPFLENAPDIAATVAVGILPNKANP